VLGTTVRGCQGHFRTNDSSGNCCNLQVVMKCPSCGWLEIRRSHRHGLREWSLRLIGIVPWRCVCCQYRWLARKQSNQQAAKALPQSDKV